MSELSNNESGRGFTHIYTATFEDLQTIGNGGQKTLATIPAGGAVEMVGVYEAEAFAGTTSLVIDVGTTGGDPTKYKPGDPITSENFAASGFAPSDDVLENLKKAREIDDLPPPRS